MDGFGGEIRFEIAGGSGLEDRSGRNADDGGHRVDVADDDCPGADDRFAADAQVLNDRRADADKRAGLDDDTPGDARSGADVSCRADHRLVIDDAAGVQDRRVSDLNVAAHVNAGGDDDIASEGGVAGDVGGGVDSVEEGEPGRFES